MPQTASDYRRVSNGAPNAEATGYERRSRHGENETPNAYARGIRHTNGERQRMITTVKEQRMQRLKAIVREAEGVAHNARLIMLACMDPNDKVAIQPQMAYLTGSVARMQKDWGVVEHLQAIQSERRG